MSLYQQYVLPHVINLAMRNRELLPYRRRVIAPGSVFEGRADNEPDDGTDGARPSRTATVGVSPLPCDQGSIPTHQGVRRDQRVEFAERLTSQRIRSTRQSAPFSVGESNAPTTEPLLQQPILFAQVFDL